MSVIYTDEGVDYPHLVQPQGTYVRDAESEFDGTETTWPVVQQRAMELQAADESDDGVE